MRISPSANKVGLLKTQNAEGRHRTPFGEKTKWIAVWFI